MTETTQSNALRIGAAYIRVSTDDQLELSPESQLAEIQAFCVRENILLQREYIFIEQDGKSGRKSKNRDAFQNMIATAKQTPKPFDVILLWEFSRFARNQDESTFYKSVLRKKLGIDVLSVKEPIPQGMYGRLIEMIIEWQDEFYSVNLSTEVKRSMRLKAQKGFYNGKVPLGYHKEPDALPVIVEDEAKIVKMIFQMFTTGYDLNYITRHLNNLGLKTATGKKFDSEGVRYILENPFYIGKIRWNRRESSSSKKLKDKEEWIVVDSHHEAIIDQDTFDAAQDKLACFIKIREKYAHPVSHTKHWLSGMVKCSICGKSLSYKHGYGANSSGFQCLGYRQCLHNESQYISETKLTKYVLSSLRSVLADTNFTAFEIVNTSTSDIDFERELYQNELKGLLKKEQRVKEAYLNEIDTLEEYKRNKEMLDRRRKELEALIAALEETSLDPEHCQENFLKKVNSVIEIIEGDAPYELKAEALRSIVKKITFHKQTQVLEFYYYISV